MAAGGAGAGAGAKNAAGRDGFRPPAGRAIYDRVRQADARARLC